MSWTDERTEILKQRWDQGRTLSQIADELGGISRNAVIGKVHRLDLPKRGQAASMPRSAKPRKKREKPQIHISRGPMLGLEKATRPLPPERKEEIPVVQRCGILDLGTGICRWPIGTPGTEGFVFCGGRAAEGKVYCP